MFLVSQTRNLSDHCVPGIDRIFIGYKLEQDKMKRSNPSATLSHELWLLKLLLGSIDRFFSNRPTHIHQPGKSKGYGRPQYTYDLPPDALDSPDAF